jgi:hypothetical protein
LRRRPYQSPVFFLGGGGDFILQLSLDVNDVLVFFLSIQDKFFLGHPGEQPVLTLNQLAVVDGHLPGPFDGEEGDGFSTVGYRPHIFDVHLFPFSIQKVQGRFVKEGDLPAFPKKNPVMGEAAGAYPPAT